MLSHYRPSRPRPLDAVVIGRYDLPLRRAMLARQLTPPAYVGPFGRVYLGLARRREATLLDHYGASSLVEFFAVATECFFEKPGRLKERHPALYAELQEFYRQDPMLYAPACPDKHEIST